MKQGLLMLLLVTLVLGSALAVVYAKHQNRKLYVQLHALQKQRDEMEVNWGRLQLEQSTWATHGRIERLARKRLGMRPMDYDTVVIVRP